MDFYTKIHLFVADNNLECDIRQISYCQFRLFDIYGKPLYDVFAFNGKIIDHKTRRYTIHFDFDSALLWIKKQILFANKK